MGAPHTPDETPFLDLLLQYARSGILPYHTPGHKQGRGAPPRLVDVLGPRPFLIDLDGELAEPPPEGPDDEARVPSAGAPSSRRNGRKTDGRAALDEAQALAASAHGANHARFLVSGSTAGLQALFMAGAGPDRPVILPRNVHRSVIGGLILSGARPVFVETGFLDEAGVATVPAPEAVAAALEREAHAAAVVVTSPTYYGWLPAVGEIARLAGAKGVPLWVDEAHGALYGFHNGLPRPALASGAAAAVRSLHKTAGSLVQSSLLLLGAGGPDPARIDSALALLQSSSPSPLLLASLDAARAWLAGGAAGRIGALLEEVYRLRDELRGVPGIRCWGPEVVGREGIADWDPTRLVLSVSDLGMTGLEAARWLRRRCGLQVEMADLKNLVVVLSPADGPRSMERLLEGLRSLAARRRRTSRCPSLAPPPLPPAVMTPREAFFAPVRRVALREAEGETAAETVAPYPPGIPVMVPGERVTRDSLEYLEGLRRAGARIEGGSDPTGETLLVVAGSPGGGRARGGGP